MAIEWRDVPGYEGIYQVSSDGQVYSKSRRLIRPNNPSPDVFWAGRHRKPRVHKCGLLMLTLHHEAVRTSHYVHALVMLAFVGPCPEGHYVHHKNGNITDNRLENLEYTAYKLSPEQVAEIRQRLAKGERLNAIAKDYGVHYILIANIRDGRVYKSQTSNF